MHPHHQASIHNLIALFRDEPGILAIILGGSVAKGLARADSDIDAILVVTEEKHAALSAANRLSECVWGHCTYEGGYFDLKYTTLPYLYALAARGSEPSRNAFASAVRLHGGDEALDRLLAAIPVFQRNEKDEKMLSFYSALDLNAGYFWGASVNNPYLRVRAASDIVLFGLRLLLQHSEVLFPCHKALLDTVAALASKPAGIVDKAEAFLTYLTDDAKNEFVNAILDFIDYVPPADYTVPLTRFIDDNELWWYKQRPVIAEW